MITKPVSKNRIKVNFCENTTGRPAVSVLGFVCSMGLNQYWKGIQKGIIESLIRFWRIRYCINPDSNIKRTKYLANF